MDNLLRAISLFSGAGGLDLGAIYAGIDIVWANDTMKDACATYRKNIGEHIVCGDINDHKEELRKFRNIDLVIGGPPCQGFSVAGKMDQNDQRSKLVWTYADIVGIVRPKAFIMENVKALAEISRWKNVRNQLLQKFRSLGYSVNYVVVNAADFSVPQSRERVFFIGFHGDSSEVPNLRVMLEPYKSESPSIRDVLSNLDKPEKENNSGLCKAKITLAKKPVLRNSAYSGMLFNGMGRPLNLDEYSVTLPASMGGNKTPIVDENALYAGSKPWVEIYYDAILNSIDNIKQFKVPSYLRRLTVQEASLLQTFPVSYQFCGPQSSVFTQIGNAVPCNLSKAVCSMVSDILQNHSKKILIEENTSMVNDIILDKNKATQILADAFDNPVEQTDELGQAITSILEGGHKTFRYILFTAILAKATDNRIDPLCLQKGKDSIEGAYDARSFCKSVVVKFEQREFPNGLGNTPDPYANKTARYERLSYSLATKDPIARDLTISILSKITTSEIAIKYLSSAVSVVKKQSENYQKSLDEVPSLVKINSTNTELIYSLIDKLTSRCCDGETCPIVIATIETLCSKDYTVVPHKVNESGKSSNEVGDIDIFDSSKNLVNTIEVKDKPFNKDDVTSAIKKAYDSRLNRCMFIYGKNANYDNSGDLKDDIQTERARFGRIGTFCTIISVEDYAKMRLNDNVENITLVNFVEKLKEMMKLINARASTISWIRTAILASRSFE